jgi:hypothetical protein
MSERQTPTEEPAHDILAAEAFAVPAEDPTLHHRPVQLPDDPSGIAEPHDVLAAEEFAMPAGRRAAGTLPRATVSAWRGGAVVGALAVLALRVLRRR